jgi:hypothetical protein
MGIKYLFSGFLDLLAFDDLLSALDEVIADRLEALGLGVVLLSALLRLSEQASCLIGEQDQGVGPAREGIYLLKD